MARTSVSQIKQIKLVYSTNVKAFYRARKTKLLEARNTRKKIVQSAWHDDMEVKIKNASRNVSVRRIAWDSYWTCIVELSVKNNFDKIKDIFESSGLASDDAYSYDSTSTATFKVKFDEDDISDREYVALSHDIEENCAEYKRKMKALGDWELEALKISHTGDIPIFDIESTEPAECIV